MNTVCDIFNHNDFSRIDTMYDNKYPIVCLPVVRIPSVIRLHLLSDLDFMSGSQRLHENEGDGCTSAFVVQTIFSAKVSDLDIYLAIETNCHQLYQSKIVPFLNAHSHTHSTSQCEHVLFKDCTISRHDNASVSGWLMVNQFSKGANRI